MFGLNAFGESDEKNTSPKRTLLAIVLATQSACANLVPQYDIDHIDNTMVIHSDPGGLINDRIRQINELYFSGITVMIVGQCLSSCTMFLALERVCASPESLFGFHGPSKQGEVLAPDVFERMSLRASEYYPEPIKTSFLEEWRYDIAMNQLNFLTGEQLINMGIISEC